jgi:hypothetical protein
VSLLGNAAELAIYPGGAHGFTLFPNDLSKGGDSEGGCLPEPRSRLTARRIRNKVIFLLSHAR